MFVLSCVFCCYFFALQDLPEPVRRLTIFQKLEIVRYANQLWQEHREKHESDNPVDDEMARRSRKRKRGLGDEVRQVIKGVNVQRACEIKFQGVIGKIKVCQLHKACRLQKWESLTEKQQKTLFHLPDSLKVSLGLSHLVKGWKSLDPESFQKLSDDNMAIKRWSVPGPVLKDSYFLDDLGVACLFALTAALSVKPCLCSILTLPCRS